MWIAALSAEGLVPDVFCAEGAGGGVLAIRIAERPYRWTIRRLRRLPKPGEIGPAPVDPTVLWLPHTTQGLRAALKRQGWSWVSDEGAVLLRSDDGAELVRLEGPGRDVPGADGAPSREEPLLPPGALRVVSHLLEWPRPARQNELAAAVGLTQARVSQVLRMTDTAGLTERGKDGWRISDAERALEACLTGPPTGPVMAWYGLDELPRQCDLALGRAAERGARVRVGGDLAADVLAPWRRPIQVVLHTDRTLDLEADGFVPVVQDTHGSDASATLLVRTAAVTGQWRTDPAVLATLCPDTLPWQLAPVNQVIHDILDTGGPDAPEAAQRLRTTWMAARSTAATTATAPDVSTRRNRRTA